jgi:large subunit ribosomal protein L29
MQMTSEEIREMTNEQIRERIGEIREEIFRLRFRGSMMQLENPQLPRHLRRDIARMKTILRERELQDEREPELQEGKA